MPPSSCYICAFACHPRLFTSKDEAAIVSQSMEMGGVTERALVTGWQWER